MTIEEERRQREAREALFEKIRLYARNCLLVVAIFVVVGAIAGTLLISVHKMAIAHPEQSQYFTELVHGYIALPMQTLSKRLLAEHNESVKTTHC